MTKENGSLPISLEALQEAEFVESEMIANIAHTQELTQSAMLYNKHWNCPEVADAIKNDNEIFINAHPFLRRQREGNLQYPEVIPPLEPSNG